MRKLFTDSESAELFKAFADETRLKIIRSLLQREKCVSGLMAELSLNQPQASHHLKILKTAGLLLSRREGQKVCYSLHPKIRENLSAADGEKLDLGCCEITFKT